MVVPGKNVLAIEGHNVNLGSSDFTLDPVVVVKRKPTATPNPTEQPQKAVNQQPLPTGKYASGSRKLVVFNRHTGELLWTREALFNFRHNNIAIGAGKVFCIDSLTPERKKALDRRGIKLTGSPTLYALDVKTGKEIWSTQENVFGTFLNYSREHDILVQGGSQYRDRARDEVARGMVAYQGSNGKVLWHNGEVVYGGPCLLWHNKILTNGQGGFALDIETGKPTGWRYSRNYGCNTAFGSEHLLTFRSGCAGFFDLNNESGTGNLGGFRSSCTNNLIVANGVLNAPDYTRTCTCAYQNQTSLALIHMPEAEFWTFGGVAKPGQIGINFGAPGNRRADNGTLWEARTPAEITPDTHQVFRLHSSFISGEELRWVASSGAIGLQRITIPVTKGKSCKVKLVFLEPQPLREGQRVFDVLLQGKTVLNNFDIVKEADGAWTGLTREFQVDASKDRIVIELRTQTKEPTVISGVEILELE